MQEIMNCALLENGKQEIRLFNDTLMIVLFGI